MADRWRGGTVTPREFGKYLKRDGGCLHCGEHIAVSPNHRANRGMGGRRARDVPSNVIVLCSVLNGLIEADARFAALALDNGWKLNSWDVPAEVPVYDRQTRAWYLLADDYSRIVVEEPKRKERL